MFSPCFPLSSSLCSHLLIIAIVLILLHYKYEEEGNREFNILKRFLYDLFNIFTGTTKQLHKIYEEINKFHPWCEVLNSKNDYTYLNLLNGTLREKIETFKQINSNEKRRQEEELVPQ